MGYVKTGSLPSIIAGCSVGLLCKSWFKTLPLPRLSTCFEAHIRDLRYETNALSGTDGLGGYRMQNRQPYGVELSLLASVVLGASAIPRAIRLKKPVPILLSILSTFGFLTFGNAYRQTL